MKITVSQPICWSAYELKQDVIPNEWWEAGRLQIPLYAVKQSLLDANKTHPRLDSRFARFLFSHEMILVQ